MVRPDLASPFPLWSFAPESNAACTLRRPNPLLRHRSSPLLQRRVCFCSAKPGYSAPPSPGSSASRRLSVLCFWPPLLLPPAVELPPLSSTVPAVLYIGPQGSSSASTMSSPHLVPCCCSATVIFMVDDLLVYLIYHGIRRYPSS